MKPDTPKEILLEGPEIVTAHLKRLHILWGSKLSPVTEAYRWAFPGLWLQDRQEHERVSGGDRVRRPTEMIATKDQRRRMARRALARIAAIEVELDQALADMNRAIGPTMPGEAKQMAVNATKGVHHDKSKAAWEQKSKWEKIADKRKLAGGGYGEN